MLQKIKEKRLKKSLRYKILTCAIDIENQKIKATTIRSVAPRIFVIRDKPKLPDILLDTKQNCSLLCNVDLFEM